jgi:hypothetical protein
MALVLEVTTTDDATFTVNNSATGRPRRSGPPNHHVGNAFAISTALVVAAVVMWVIVLVLAIVTLANEGLHANWR